MSYRKAEQGDQYFKPDTGSTIYILHHHERLLTIIHEKKGMFEMSTIETDLFNHLILKDIVQFVKTGHFVSLKKLAVSK